MAEDPVIPGELLRGPNAAGEWRRGGLAEGLACYCREEFFEAHEHWEGVWLKLEEPEKSFLQALIQISAAFHHLHANNPAGAVSLLQRALRRLERCPAKFGGIAVEPLREQASQWLRVLRSGVAGRPSAFPRIEPVDLVEADKE
jgi:predicted metal-dependent hydrolase